MMKYSDEMRTFILENYMNKGNVELTEIFNKAFKTDVKVSQIKAYKNNHNLSSGLTGRFQKGIIPQDRKSVV